MCSPTSRSRRSSRARTNFSSRPEVLRTFGRIAALGALCGFLLYRLAPDVRGQPHYEGEALSRLIALRPLGGVLGTLLLAPRGAPVRGVSCRRRAARRRRTLEQASALGGLAGCRRDDCGHPVPIRRLAARRPGGDRRRTAIACLTGRSV